ncbi:MAG: polysaccharide deacetylase family protein [Pyrinomonadaceae bacterium]|jgi:peptidoglycan/xylan/chitin deacetylase (PgdA/CDA1 family)|nr:polysaccharide deacetylase family protein [Pyrinomonadaceae bacterium]
MKTKPLILTLVFLTTSFSTVSVDAQKLAPRGGRTVAVTIDDLPVVSLRHDLASQATITRKLLHAIKSHRVPAIGFVNENKLLSNGKRDQRRVGFLRMWLDAGLDLGNHTFSHPDLHRIPLDSFKEDVIRGEEVTSMLLKAKGRGLRYFRHPFLHSGNNLETKHKFEEFLAQRGYRIAPVTIDNSEWIFARAYENALVRGDEQMAQRVAEAYIPYMEKKFAYFEQQSMALFGYEMKQVLLLHANALNADYFDKLARMIKKRSYKFISLDEALTDKAYTSPDTYAGPGGITWIHRWAITARKDDDFFRGEPRTPAFVLKKAGVTAE